MAVGHKQKKCVLRNGGKQKKSERAAEYEIVISQRPLDMIDRNFRHAKLLSHLINLNKDK